MKGQNWSISLEQVEEILLLLIWFSFPIVVPFIISRFFTPIYITRYTIGASPALYLLVAKGISTFTKKKAIYLVLMLIVVLSLPGLQYYYAHDESLSGERRQILLNTIPKRMMLSSSPQISLKYLSIITTKETWRDSA